MTAIVDDYLNADQIAEILGVTRARVWQLRARGQLPPAIKVGRIVLWDRAEFVDFINESKEK